MLECKRRCGRATSAFVRVSPTLNPVGRRHRHLSLTSTVKRLGLSVSRRQPSKVLPAQAAR